MIYEIIKNHGRVEDYLKYALIVGDFSELLNHYINYGKYAEAIEVLEKHVLIY